MDFKKQLYGTVRAVVRPELDSNGVSWTDVFVDGELVDTHVTHPSQIRQARQSLLWKPSPANAPDQAVGDSSRGRTMRRSSLAEQVAEAFNSRHKR